MVEPSPKIVGGKHLGQKKPLAKEYLGPTTPASLVTEVTGRHLRKGAREPQSCAVTRTL